MLRLWNITAAEQVWSVVKTTLSYFSNHIKTMLSVSTQDTVRFLLLRVLLHGLTSFFYILSFLQRPKPELWVRYNTGYYLFSGICNLLQWWMISDFLFQLYSWYIHHKPISSSQPWCNVESVWNLVPAADAQIAILNELMRPINCQG